MKEAVNTISKESEALFRLANSKNKQDYKNAYVWIKQHFNTNKELRRRTDHEINVGARINSIASNETIEEYVNDDLKEQFPQRARMATSLGSWVRSLNETPMPIVVICQQERIMYCNELLSKLSGYDIEELIGASLMQLLPRSAKQNHSKHVLSYTKNNPKMRNMSSRLPLKLVTKSGNEKRVKISIAQKVTDGGTYSIAYVTDIEEAQNEIDNLNEDKKEIQGKLNAANNLIIEGETKIKQQTQRNHTIVMNRIVAVMCLVVTLSAVVSWFTSQGEIFQLTSIAVVGALGGAVGGYFVMNKKEEE